MKKLLFVAVSISFLFSCKEADKTVPVADVPAPTNPVAEAVNYPYQGVLASDLKLGNPKKTVEVMEMYKILEAGKSVDSLLLPYFADTVTSISFDEKKFHGSAADFTKKVSEFRSQFKSLNEEFITFVSLRSDEKDLDFVSVWFKERVVRNNGKADSTLYQENWRFNKEGKIYYRTAFARYGF